MNTVEAAVGENDDDIAALTVLTERIENGVGIGKSLRLDALGTKISCKLDRRELFTHRNRIQRYMLSDQDLVGLVKNAGIVLLKHGPPAGIGARLKNDH